MLDYSQDDTLTLRRTCMLSTSWVHPSQRHLLRIDNVHVDGSRALHKFTDTLRGPEPIGQYITSLTLSRLAVPA